MPERREPAEKLPLAARKNVRDSWESVKGDKEQQLTDLFGGEPWTINIDAAALWPYGNDGEYARNAPGELIASYVGDAIESLKHWFEYRSEADKSELLEACTARTLTMDLDVDEKFSYCGCKIDDEGKLVIVFGENYLGTNISDALTDEKLDQAVNEAPALSEKPIGYFPARRDIRGQYEPEVGGVQDGLRELLGDAELTFVPNFESNFAKIRAAEEGGRDREWKEGNLGNFTLQYFKAFVEYLKSNSFGSDDMLKEGLLEVMEKKEVHFRLVDETKKSYNETVVEDGIVYLQCKPSYFGTNIDQIAEGLIDIL